MGFSIGFGLGTGQFSVVGLKVSTSTLQVELDRTVVSDIFKYIPKYFRPSPSEHVLSLQNAPGIRRAFRLRPASPHFQVAFPSRHTREEGGPLTIEA